MYLSQLEDRILVSTAINSASAVTLNYSGRFGDTISCFIEELPSNSRTVFNQGPLACDFIITNMPSDEVIDCIFRY